MAPHFCLQLAFRLKHPSLSYKAVSTNHTEGKRITSVGNCFSPEYGGCDWTSVKSGVIEQKLGTSFLPL